MPKLPMYVFKRSNGSYRYKRNVPKDLREANAQTHIFTELGWKKKKFSWNGMVQKYAWYKVIDAEKEPARGQVYTGKITGKYCDYGWVSMASQEDAVLDLLSYGKGAGAEDDK